MENMLVAVFETERQASAAARAMKELNTEGLALVYALAVIVKGSENIAIVNFARGENASDPALGIAIRSFIDLLRGSRSFIGDNATECAADWMVELANAGVDDGLLENVSRHLLPGTAAIVCEVDEERLTPMNALVESQRGMVFRCARRKLMDARIAKELDALHREIQTFEEQLTCTFDESRARLQAALDLANGKFSVAKDRARYRAASIKREAEAKIVLLQDRAAKADGRVKARLHRLVNEVRIDCVNRLTTLNLLQQIDRGFLQILVLALLLT